METPMHLIITTIIIRMIITTTTTTMVTATITKELISIIMDKMEVTWTNKIKGKIIIINTATISLTINMKILLKNKKNIEL